MSGVLKAPSSLEEGVGGGGPTRAVLLERAARMRSNPTEPERRLWMALRDSRLEGHKFRRRAIMDYRIVDFFCPAKGLVIELDGNTHDPEADLLLDAKLERTTGFVVIRFTNEDVMKNLDGVLTAIILTLQERPDRWSERRATTPQPPPLKRRGSKMRQTNATSTLVEGVGGGGT
jgi:very-short-patch-repair endonuclease